MPAPRLDPQQDPELAARNRRTAIILAVVAVLVYAVFVLRYLR